MDAAIVTGLDKGNDDEDPVLSAACDACDAWMAARTPGELAVAADIIIPVFRGSLLPRLRNAAVKDYDAKRIARAETGLPPLQWSENDPLPEAGTLDNSLIRAAEFMRGVNREILKRQAEANLHHNS